MKTILINKYNERDNESRVMIKSNRKKRELVNDLCTNSFILKFPENFKNIGSSKNVDSADNKEKNIKSCVYVVKKYSHLYSKDYTAINHLPVNLSESSTDTQKRIIDLFDDQLCEIELNNLSSFMKNENDGDLKFNHLSDLHVLSSHGSFPLAYVLYNKNEYKKYSHFSKFRYLNYRYSLFIYEPCVYGDLVQFANHYSFKMKYSVMLIKQVIYQLLIIIEVIHRNGIAHRDIKLDNILIVDTNFDQEEYIQDRRYIKSDLMHNYDDRENKKLVSSRDVSLSDNSNRVASSSSSSSSSKPKNSKRDNSGDHNNIKDKKQPFIWIKLSDWEFSIDTSKLIENYSHIVEKKPDGTLGVPLSSPDLNIPGTVNYSPQELLFRTCSPAIKLFSKLLESVSDHNDLNQANKMLDNMLKNEENIYTDFDLNCMKETGFFGQFYDPRACDIASIGYVMSYLLFRKFPRVSFEDIDTMDDILYCKDFFMACCNPIASKRSSASELLKHKFITTEKSVNQFKNSKDFSGLTFTKLKNKKKRKQTLYSQSLLSSSSTSSSSSSSKRRNKKKHVLNRYSIGKCQSIFHK